MRWPCHSTRSCSSASVARSSGPRQARKAAQEAGAVGVQAHVAQRPRARQGRAASAVAPPGQRRAAEVQRPLARRAPPSRRWGSVTRRRRDGVRGRAHHAVGALGQQRGARPHQGRVDQRLVALHVDDDASSPSSPSSVAGLGQAVAAAGMVAARQHGAHAVRRAGLQRCGCRRRPPPRAARRCRRALATRTTMGTPAMSASGLSGRRVMPAAPGSAR
jgi:hypothetical protein